MPYLEPPRCSPLALLRELERFWEPLARAARRLCCPRSVLAAEHACAADCMHRRMHRVSAAARPWLRNTCCAAGLPGRRCSKRTSSEVSVEGVGTPPKVREFVLPAAHLLGCSPHRSQYLLIGMASQLLLSLEGCTCLWDPCAEATAAAPGRRPGGAGQAADRKHAEGCEHSSGRSRQG